MILAIDPGLRWCGCALGEESPIRLLKKAALVSNPDNKARGPNTWQSMALAVLHWVDSLGNFSLGELELHIEVPRYYPRQRYVEQGQNVDPNDLMELCGVVGALSVYWPPRRWYYPAQWKGQVPKKVMTERIRKQLRPVELENIISVGAKDHNTLDAVGIYLYAVGRL